MIGTRASIQRRLVRSIATLPVVFLLVLSACETDSQKPEGIADDRELFWSLSLDHRAVALSMSSPNDTLTITATPKNYLEEPLTGLPAPKYLSRDLERVAVTSEGKLVAVAPSSQPVWVIATLTIGNLKHSDSALIAVRAAGPVPTLASFSIHPVAPDSAKLAARPKTGLDNLKLTDTLVPRALDPSDAPITGLPVFFRSSDPSIATVHPITGEVLGQRPGNVTVFAGITAFGVTKEDTLPYRIGWPLVGVIAMEGSDGYIWHPEVTVGVGAVVEWVTLTKVFLGPINDIDIVFSDADRPNVAAATLNTWLDPSFFPSFCPAFRVECTNSGDIALSTANRGAVRAFFVAGTYQYQSLLHGTAGKLIVVNESE